MIKGKPARAYARSARSKAAGWTVARAMLLALLIAYQCLPQIAHGKTRAGLLRFLERRASMLEHIFRCLLLCMRVAPAPRQPSALRDPIESGLPRTRRLRRSATSALLSLSELAKGFETNGKPVPALSNLKQKRRLDRLKARDEAFLEGPHGPTAAAPVADPLEQIGARLKAMRALLANPVAHAAILVARLNAAGIFLRRAVTVTPHTELWAHVNHCPSVALATVPASFSDTS